MMENGRISKKSVLAVLTASFGYLAGFSIIFAMLGSIGTDIGGYLLYNIRSLRILSGIFILITGVLMSGRCFNTTICAFLPSQIFWFLSPLLGASFALVYSPCIPPVLSTLLSYVSIEENTVRGFYLLFIYGIGLSAAFVIAGVAFAMPIGAVAKKMKQPYVIIYGGAFILMVLGIMAITGFMVYYKAFLLSFFVE
jgi:cytochrome c-type biogenesis protein